MLATVHQNKKVSIEAAKLLGVAFTWRGSVCAYRLVTHDGEAVVELRSLVGLPPEDWRRSSTIRGAHEFECDVKRYLMGEGNHLRLVTFADDADGIVWPVTFDDEDQFISE